MILESLEAKINRMAELLSAVSGLPIKEQIFNPQDLHSFPVDSSDYPLTRIPFAYALILGDEGEQYHLLFDNNFTEEYSSGSWIPSNSWSVMFNGQQVSSRGYTVARGADLKLKDIEQNGLHNARLQELLKGFGGINIEVPFMDYERYTVESLENGDSYFKNIYLVFMTHLKERGLTMPPILCKNIQIQEAMDAGDVEEVNKLLASATILVSAQYDDRCLAHMMAEAEDIRDHTAYIRQKRDPLVPLTEKFSHLHITRINGGKPGQRAFPKYHILVVENDRNNYGQFTRDVTRSLERDGRYEGTSLITEVNLSMCMHLCNTGQVDLVLFDWSRPSYEEALMVQRDRNSFYDMFHGRSQGVISFEDEQMIATVTDGQVFDQEALKEEAEGVNIRSRWMDMIASDCHNAGVEAPPHYIFRSAEEYSNVAKIVSQQLGNPLS